MVTKKCAHRVINEEGATDRATQANLASSNQKARIQGMLKGTTVRRRKMVLTTRKVWWLGGDGSSGPSAMLEREWPPLPCESLSPPPPLTREWRFASSGWAKSECRFRTPCGSASCPVIEDGLIVEDGLIDDSRPASCSAPLSWSSMGPPARVRL